MTKKSEYYKKALPVDAPLFHNDHARPVSRRDFIRQGFMTGSATVLSGSVLGMFANPNQAHAALSSDMEGLAAEINCSLGGGLSSGSKIPFICFDLAGGANFAGSNVLAGGAGGQDDLNAVSTAGYSKFGVPGDMVPGQDSSNFTFPAPSGAGIAITSTNNDFVSDQLGLKFHADSAMLRGILDTAGTSVGNIDGCVIPARSDNDTGNNPHNPLYGIAKTGASGDVVNLIGSRNSESGGNSMAPMNLIDPEQRPTKVDRPSDVTGMVDVGNLTGILNQPADVAAVMESMARISHKKLKAGALNSQLGISNDEVVKDLVRCGYLKAADLADRFAGRQVDPLQDTDITNIFSTAGLDLNNDGEFRKTASIMKMVLNGHSAAGCVTMGGYDYHTGDRAVGELRDRRAGRCIGACLNYAAVLGQPLMIYVFSDGSVASNGMADNSAEGRGKGQWTGDNSSTASSFILIYNPPILGGLPSLRIASRQIGQFSGDASVVTSSSPAANNVNLLVNTVLLNYMAINGDEGLFADPQFFPNHGLGSAYDNFIAFDAFPTS